MLNEDRFRMRIGASQCAVLFIERINDLFQFAACFYVYAYIRAVIEIYHARER